jgi:hypothetical protein
MPGVASVVVVQSDELAAWVGVAGVAVGVVLTTGIEALRRHFAARTERTQVILDGGSGIYDAGNAYLLALRIAGDRRAEQPWAEMIASRHEALRAEKTKVMRAAAMKSVRTASKAGRRARALYEVTNRLHDAFLSDEGDAERTMAFNAYYAVATGGRIRTGKSAPVARDVKPAS